MADPVVLPDWVNTTFPEDVRSDPAIAPLFAPDDKGNPADMAKYKTPLEFIKSYRQQTELVGRKGVIVPNEKSSPEEIKAYQKALGWPETPDGYKFSDIKDMHPSLKVSPESQKAFVEAMHKEGIPNVYADKLNQFAVKYLSDAIKSGEAAFNEKQQEGVKTLKASWGDKFDENLKSAKTLVEKISGKDGAAAFGDLGNNPAVLTFLHKLSTVISEDSIAKLVTTGGAQMPEQEAAVKEIADIIEDAKGGKKHPMNDEKHADHRKWQGADGLWAKLHQKAYKPQGA